MLRHRNIAAAVLAVTLSCIALSANAQEGSLGVDFGDVFVDGPSPIIGPDPFSPGNDPLAPDDFGPLGPDDTLPIVFEWSPPVFPEVVDFPVFGNDEMPVPPGGLTNDIIKLANLERTTENCYSSKLPKGLASLFCPEHIAYLERCNAPAAAAAELYVDLRLRVPSVPVEKRLEVIDAYDANCLVSPDLSDAASQTARFIRSDIVALFSRTDPSFACTGIRVGVHRVLTAKHCIFDPSSRQLLDVKDFSAFPANAPNQAFAVAAAYFGGAHSFDPTRDLDDVAVLDLASDLPPADDQVLELAEAADNAPMLAIGINGLMLIRDALAPPSAIDTAKDGFRGWLRFVRIDDAASCVIVKAAPPGCIVHGCQTYPGMSGGALLLRGDDPTKNVLLGIITKAQRPQDRTDCSSDLVATAPNVGLALDTDTVLALITMKVQ